MMEAMVPGRMKWLKAGIAGCALLMVLMAALALHGLTVLPVGPDGEVTVSGELLQRVVSCVVLGGVAGVMAIVLALSRIAAQERLDRLAAQELEAARRRAQEASEAKGRFIANMSHEMRTPMNAIIGLGELLQGEAGLSAEQREKVRLINVSAEGLLRLVDDVLDTARLEAGRLELERAPFSLAVLVADTMALMEVQARDKGLSLQWSLHPDLPPAFWGDAARIRQVLVNLVGNAVKFTETGGVTLEAAGEGVQDGRVRVRFEVTDTGLGISEEEKARLFEAFYQADGSMTRRHGGTGLGLSITRELVRRMGGDIGVEGVRGRGSRFTFHLDLEPCGEEAVGAVGPPPMPEPAAGLDVLLVEDNEVNQAVTLRQLERLGLRPRLARDGREAVREYERRAADVVLMDCQMPVMDGHEATRRIRALEVARGVRRSRILALTAHALEEERRRCAEAGMDGHLAKPVRLAELRAALSGAVPATEDTDQGEGGSLIDYARLNDVVDHDPRELLSLLEIYRSQGRDEMGRLATAAAAGDLEQTRRVAHKMAGSSAIIGARSLESLLRQIERRSQAGDTGTLRHDVPEALRLFASVEGEIASRLASDPSHPQPSPETA